MSAFFQSLFETVSYAEVGICDLLVLLSFDYLSDKFTYFCFPDVFNY